SGADCLTCYFTAFQHGADHRESIYAYTPIGGDLASGMVANVFGDANFIVRREVFQSIGGFGTDRRTSYEDYDFLFRLVEGGWDLAVIPQFLFYYRHLESGFSRVTNARDNQLRAVSAALEGVPDWQRRFLTASLGAFSEMHAMRSQASILQNKVSAAQQKIAALKADLKAAKASAKTKATVARPHFLKRLEQGLRHHVLRPLVAGLRPRRKVLHHAPPVMAPMETAPRATAPQRTTQPKAKPAPATRR
ncbi:MAG TPA: hypothetical protein P5016_21125, partial [Verrucomicrobiales bacterium]|nr:hypothetical protein [Verrucomicrobiales bacterium]